MEPNEKVTGIGGVFFKSRDPKELKRWYAEQLGVPLEHDNIAFTWTDPLHPAGEGMTVLGMFAAESRYFEPSKSPFMLNFRVRDLDAMLAQLRAAGVTVDDKVDDSEYGRFGWILDPDGNRVELWEPPGARNKG
jgi:predicted enzyme related to lactoylglutathione lyase